MNVLYFIIPLALLLGLFFVFSFIMAILKGQFENLDSAATRILIDDSNIQRKDDHAKDL
ncbi:MAG: cbb3-type cytochrome oxidase assembly protein CcoS [Bacteriovoracaceae bacterium]